MNSLNRDPRVWRAVAESGSGSWMETPAGRVRAAFGAGGLKPAEEKREGDGASPVGRWPVLFGYFRSDRLERPESAIALRPIREDDGWCDASRDRAYNRPVRLPYAASHEEMRRTDELYDIVLVLGHNHAPPQPEMGSAIFLHCKRGDYEPTRGCVAIDRDDLIAWLAAARPGDFIEISDA
jgi:L,D-peptidoglycan transpeptidase YkuD (ErfK/YbiS/YcfS/YnhG family)